MQLERELTCEGALHTPTHMARRVGALEARVALLLATDNPPAGEFLALKDDVAEGVRVVSLTDPGVAHFDQALDLGAGAGPVVCVRAGLAAIRAFVRCPARLG